jgi:hypothetical protein
LESVTPAETKFFAKMAFLTGSMKTENLSATPALMKKVIQKSKGHLYRIEERFQRESEIFLRLFEEIYRKLAGSRTPTQ